MEKIVMTRTGLQEPVVLFLGVVAIGRMHQRDITDFEEKNSDPQSKSERRDQRVGKVNHGGQGGQHGLEHPLRHLWFFKDIREVNALSTECVGTRGCEHVHDEDDLMNHCSLEVIGIRHRYHTIQECEK